MNDLVLHLYIASKLIIKIGIIDGCLIGLLDNLMEQQEGNFRLHDAPIGVLFDFVTNWVKLQNRLVVFFLKRGIELFCQKVIF